MENNKHTPAPWMLGNPDRDNNTEIYGDDFLSDGSKANGKINICTVWGDNAGSLHDDINSANAKLIYAAPDLLNAAKMAIEYIAEVNYGDKRRQAYQYLLEAIKKATT